MIGVKWVGWDGSEWDLNSGRVHLTKAGIAGLGSLTFDDFTQDTALLDGQRFTGWRAQPRPVLLPILIGQAATDLEWLATDRAWWHTMHPAKPGSLIVTASDGQARSIKLRFVDDGNMAFEVDPTINRMSTAVVNMIADDPWWIGKSFSQRFSGGSTPINWLGGAAGKGPPLIFGSANTLGAATLTNPGEVDVWPTHYIDGPVGSFNITINGAPVSASMTLSPTQQLRIETSPDRQVAYLVDGGVIGPDGIKRIGTETNVTKLLEHVEFARVPAGLSVPVSITLNGTGNITIAGDPRFFRAW